ncbi:MAG: hypothetical protein V4456_11265 [Bacteroidota bacterium]
MNAQELKISIEINSEATDRQLYRYYREGVKHLNTVTERYNSGSQFHLGDNIIRVLRTASQDLDITINELKKRNIDPAKIKNVPALVTKKTKKELECERIGKALLVEQQKNETSLFDKWYNKEVTGLGSFDIALFELFLMASPENRTHLRSAFPIKFNNLKFGL